MIHRGKGPEILTAQIQKTNSGKTTNTAMKYANICQERISEP